jgi:hypothetical protein
MVLKTTVYPNDTKSHLWDRFIGSEELKHLIECISPIPSKDLKDFHDEMFGDFSAPLSS